MDIRGFRKVAVPLATASMLQAMGCTSRPPTAPPDLSPPQVVTRSPGVGTTDFRLGDSIQVTFSEPVAASSVTSSSIQLVGAQGAAVASTCSASADRLTYTVKPRQPLAVTGADVLGLEVVLTDAIKDDAGNALVVPSDRWRFSAPAFLPVGALGAPSGEPGGLAWDTQGRLWLGSVDREGDGTVARVRRLDSGVWSVLPEMGVDPASSELELALALGLDGSPVVAFTEANQVYVRRWDGTAWSPFGTVTGPVSGGGLAFRPAIAVSRTTGFPVVAWIESGLAFALRWTGTGFVEVGGSSVPTTGTADEAGETVSLALDGETVLLAWTEVDGTGHRGVRVHASVGGTSAWAPIGGQISVNAGVETAAASLALDGSTPVLAFFEREACPTCERLVQVMRYANGWSAVGAARNRQANQLASNPRIAVAGTNRYVVAWQETPVHNQVHLDQWDGTQWIALERSLLNEGGNAVGLALALDGSGVPTVAWWESGSPYLMYVQRYNQ